MIKLQQTLAYIYNDMLEVLPPEVMTHGRTRDGITFSCFLVGEPTTHRANGVPVYTSYFTMNDLYYVGEAMTRDELLQLAERPDDIAEAVENADVPENGHVADVREAIDEFNEEIVEAYADNVGWGNVTLDAIQEAYSGAYDSDEKFAQDMAEQLGYIQEDVQWPYTAIDWERAARDLMYDYFESNGHYFRNI